MCWARRFEGSLEDWVTRRAIEERGRKVKRRR
jgi:hypothetical protein